MKPAIDIHIDNHYQAKVYTSGSAISGHVSISPPRDVRFDSVQILLLGTTKTRIDGVSVPQATCHTFLKLVMPVAESCYPAPRVFEAAGAAGAAYSVPFYFVVPDHLTINACSHRVANDAVRAYHLRPPPTVGSWDRDDLAPDMARVEYAIKARVLRDEAAADGAGAVVRVLEASREVRVLPAHAAEPPLSIAPGDRLYAASRSKAVRRTILSARQGRVTASAAQPRAAMLGPDGRYPAVAAGAGAGAGADTTSARLDLRFEPAPGGARGDAPPPRVSAVSAKITAVTYYSASGVRCLPNLGDWGRSFGCEGGSGSYSSTTSLPSSSLTAPQVVWKKQLQQQQQQHQEHSSVAQARRDSGYGSDDGPSDSDRPLVGGGGGDADEKTRERSITSTTTITTAKTQAKRKTKERKSSSSSSSKTGVPAPVYYYTASLQVPVRLPTEKKTFLPTFHSCIASRVYVLWLTVSLSCGGGTGSGSSLTLGVPLQVGVESAKSLLDPPLPPPLSLSLSLSPSPPPSFETAIEEAEADAFLRPRILSVPDVQFARSSSGGGSGGGGGGYDVMGGLPGYADLVAARTRRSVPAY